MIKLFSVKVRVMLMVLPLSTAYAHTTKLVTICVVKRETDANSSMQLLTANLVLGTRFMLVISLAVPGITVE